MKFFYDDFVKDKMCLNTPASLQNQKLKLLEEALIFVMETYKVGTFFWTCEKRSEQYHRINTNSNSDLLDLLLIVIHKNEMSTQIDTPYSMHLVCLEYKVIQSFKKV